MMNLKSLDHLMEVYTESQKRKTLVGTLAFDKRKKEFIFRYDPKYIKSKRAIAVGPELPLRRRSHCSKKLFASFSDRIPSKRNPAYVDYCRSQGISPNETNPIILLTTIGRRGPSTFVFEAVYTERPEVRDEMISFRKSLRISLEDMGKAFDLNTITIHRIEKGLSRDKNTMRLIEIYLNHPKVTLELIHSRRQYLHHKTYMKLVKFFEGK